MARSIGATLVLIFMVFNAGCRRQPDNRTLVALWLERNCTVAEGDETDLETEIRKRGTALEPLFIEAFSNGPAYWERATVLASVKSTYDLRQDRLRAGETYGLSVLEADAVRNVPLAVEQEMAASEFDQGYRAAALNALGVIGRPAGRQLLERLAAEESSPFQDTAEGALGKRAK